MKAVQKMEIDTDSLHDQKESFSQKKTARKTRMEKSKCRLSGKNKKKEQKQFFCFQSNFKNMKK
jgi:hypothetical protein